MRSCGALAGGRALQSARPPRRRGPHVRRLPTEHALPTPTSASEPSPPPASDGHRSSMHGRPSWPCRAPDGSQESH
jgi:hypothetical protein